ncbi:MAG TPA: YceK/YidQ family lipoprotein [Candidatus Acidoferrum sp.]|nr:YceK/YidQ family lipoprotein [Candidatus Acidoferrum sp.]
MHPAVRHDKLSGVTSRSSKPIGGRSNVRRIRAAMMYGSLLAVIAGMTSGCGTWMNHHTGDHHVYGGVKRDWRDIGAQETPEAVAIVTALDLPLSAIADTLCAPWDMAKTDE